MALDDEYKRYPSHMRIVTLAEEQTRVEQVLEEATRYLARMESTPTAQRLKLALDVFRHEIEQWYSRPPTHDQIVIMREHLGELLLLARLSEPSAKLRQSA